LYYWQHAFKHFLIIYYIRYYLKHGTLLFVDNTNIKCELQKDFMQDEIDDLCQQIDKIEFKLYQKELEISLLKKGLNHADICEIIYQND